jgi:hypothetical protein
MVRVANVILMFELFKSRWVLSHKDCDCSLYSSLCPFLFWVGGTFCIYGRIRNASEVLVTTRGHCIIVILIRVFFFFAHYLLLYCTSSPIVFLWLLPASIPRFYYFIHPLYILDMTDSILLCYLPIVSF